MKGWTTTCAKFSVIALAILALLVGAAAAILQSSRFKDWLLAEVSQRSGFAIQAESFAFRLPFAIVASQVEVFDTARFHFQARHLDASLNLWSRRINSLIVDNAKLALDLDALMARSDGESVQIVLRELWLQNSELILKRGDATLLELTKINLRAQDINWGNRSGVTFVADVPRINRTAKITMTGQPRDFAARITLRPMSSMSFFNREKSDTDYLQLNLQFRSPSGEAISALVDGKFQGIRWAGNQFTGNFTGAARLNADLNRATFSGQLALANFPQAFPVVPWRLGSGAVSAKFAGDYLISERLVTIESLQLSAPFGSALAEGKLSLSGAPTIVGAKVLLRDLPLALVKANLPAPFNGPSMGGSARLSADVRGPWSAPIVNGVVECSDGQLHAADWSVANFAFTAPFEWQRPTLRFKDVKSHVRKIAYAPQSNWQFAAERFAVESSLEYQPDQPLKFTGRFDAGGVKFNSADNTRIGENIGFTGLVEITINPANRSIKVVSKSNVGNGELLWGKFFGDLKSQKPSFELDADYLRTDDRLWCRRCTLSLAAVGSVEAIGTVDQLNGDPLLSVHATTNNFSPQGFFEFFLRETFNRQYPLLDKITVAGQLGFDVRFDGKLDALSAVGELSVENGELRAKSVEHGDWRIGSIALDLPLQIQIGANVPATSSARRVGNLTIGSLRFADQTLAPITTPLSLTHNALRLHQPLRLNIFGGTVEINDLLWPDFVNEPKRLSFSAAAKKLRLENLTAALHWPRFGGTLTGSIPNVQASENQLSARGEIMIELFGGRVRLNNLSIDNPFSSLASFRLDAKVDDLQLEQLTQTFAFGRISGILEGSIDHLVLVDGQPSELTADLHSVDRGGEQRISVEALNKITVLSSGEDAGALYGGLAGFFDSFRYSKLGVKMTLKNDRLNLRGVESRGDQEMLVVGSFLPPTVNIVSHTQAIGFSELLRRLERINKTGKPNVK